MSARHAAGWLGAFVLLACLTGCAGLRGGAATASAPTVGEAYEKVRISYRADSARLAALAAPHGGQLVSYTDGGVPPGTMATLDLRYPHPQHGPEWAQAIVTFEAGPNTPTTALEDRSIIKRVWKRTREELPGLNGPHWSHERRVLDIPKWQLDRLVMQVRDSGFLRSNHVLSPDVFMAAQIDGLAGRKNWDHFPELDALLLRARMEGQLVSQTLPPGSPSQQAAMVARGPQQQPGAVAQTPPGGGGYFDALTRAQGSAPTSDGWAVGAAGDVPASDPRVVRLPGVQ